VLTVGVDLAAGSKGTAVALVEWDAGQATVTRVRRGADDDVILDAIGQADKAGIDCPLGWPDDFVAFISSHHQHDPAPVPPSYPANGWKRRLTLRLTDHVVKAETGLTPLSVSADLIGHVALRCACLLAEAGRRGQDVDRSGDGVIVEAYPAASLWAWGLTHKRYKKPGSAQALDGLVDNVMRDAPWLQLGAAESTCRESHDVFDAVIAALTARAATRGLTRRPQTETEAAAAGTEGWIAFPLPATTLADLIS
jgi:predicted nuclease with RNAse H fold